MLDLLVTYFGAMVVGIVILVFLSSTGNSMMYLMETTHSAPGAKLPTFIWKMSGLVDDNITAVLLFCLASSCIFFNWEIVDSFNRILFFVLVFLPHLNMSYEVP